MCDFSTSPLSLLSALAPGRMRRDGTIQSCRHEPLLASVLQAASARDFLNTGALEAAPRGRDLLKLAHCRTDSSPARPTKTSKPLMISGSNTLGYAHVVRRARRAFHWKLQDASRIVHRVS